MKKAPMDILVKQPGPKPGSKEALPQHNFIAQGYTVPSTPRRTNMFQKNRSTGDTKAPGLTNKK